MLSLLADKCFSLVGAGAKRTYRRDLGIVCRIRLCRKATGAAGDAKGAKSRSMPHLHFGLGDPSDFSQRGEYDVEVQEGTRWIRRQSELLEGNTFRVPSKPK
jgi:hypothetical protein